MNCDTDLDIREEVKESMKLPWRKRPFYHTNAKDTTPQIVRRERRNRKLLRMWYHFCDDYFDLAFCVVLAALGTGLIALWATWPR